MRRTYGINVVELIVVVVIFAVIALIAVPRLTRAAGVSDEAQLLRDRLQILRVAIERYRQDQGVWPGFPANDADAQPRSELFVRQLTKYVDKLGSTADARDALHPLGPYLRDGIPACPVPPVRGSTTVHVVVDDVDSPPSSAGGWIYDARTGRIRANSDYVDVHGHAYGTY